MAKKVVGDYIVVFTPNIDKKKLKEVDNRLNKFLQITSKKSLATQQKIERAYIKGKQKTYASDIKLQEKQAKDSKRIIQDVERKRQISINDTGSVLRKMGRTFKNVYKEVALVILASIALVNKEYSKLQEKIEGGKSQRLALQQVKGFDPSADLLKIQAFFDLATLAGTDDEEVRGGYQDFATKFRDELEAKTQGSSAIRPIYRALIDKGLQGTFNEWVDLLSRVGASNKLTGNERTGLIDELGGGGFSEKLTALFTLGDKFTKKIDDYMARLERIGVTRDKLAQVLESRALKEVSTFKQLTDTKIKTATNLSITEDVAKKQISLLKKSAEAEVNRLRKTPEILTAKQATDTFTRTAENLNTSVVAGVANIAEIFKPTEEERERVLRANPRVSGYLGLLNSKKNYEADKALNKRLNNDNVSNNVTNNTLTKTVE